MKAYIKRYGKWAMILSLSLNQACNLDEYNPSGATTEETFQTYQGLDALVNSAYVYWGAQFYGREDIMMLTEGGTDLWINIANSGYGRQMTKYDGLVSTTGQIANTWNRLYEIVNYCNAGISRIDAVEFPDEQMKKSRKGELYFIRAYAYWHLVEQYGNVDLRTTETTDVNLTATRSPINAFYDLMLQDLDVAIENLPVDPYPASDVGRATLKAAYGLKARVALTYVSYLTDQNQKDQYYTEARDAAQYVIDHQGELKVSLYNTPAEVFAPGNNKTNKEAMFVVTHSTVPSLNPNPGNPNRLHMWFKAKYSSKAGLVMDYQYGNDNNAKSGSFSLMPTRYMLEIYNENIDARYNAWFREKYYLNVPSYSWKADDLASYEKSSSLTGTTLHQGDLALWFTKQSVPDKRNLPYAVVDIDDIYNGEVVTTNAHFNLSFPVLTKYDDPDLPATNSQIGTKDVIVMRLAEMYFIAAECEMNMSGGDRAKAVNLLNVIRRRAAIPGKEDQMLISDADLNMDFLMEEKARELGGEHLRWFDLKRTKRLVSSVKAHNKDIPLIQEYHMVRPIPQTFLNALLNADEFGQNPGY